ncbi:MAG TPA: HTH domain-containing protein [Candidatus Bilamarchaeum sp.]|nr:HTH domain-containing protein [Candidatus Bilamarchaeum sp.]
MSQQIKQNEVKKWTKGVVFWPQKGGAKSSESKSSFRKRKKKTEQIDSREAKPSQQNKTGRPYRLDRQKHENLLRAYYSHPYSFRELADMFGVSRMTVWRAVQSPEAVP